MQASLPLKRPRDRRLPAVDINRILRCIAEAASLETDDPFPPERLAMLRELVPCDIVCYSELDRVRHESIAYGEFPRYDGELPPQDLYWEIRHEYPTCHYHEVTGDFRAYKLSDFMTQCQLHRSRLYTDWFRPVGVEYEMNVGLDAPPWHTKVFLFDRCGGRDFTERDRAVLDTLRPHLAHLYAAAQTKRRLREALALEDASGTAVVFLEARDRVGFASIAARELIGRYFGASGARLPEPLASWLRERRGASVGEPLRVDARDRSLVVELVDGALLLEERQQLPRLTARERQILDLVAEGRTNVEIAERLWVTPATVRKHLENVFAKLGVHTRTAAAAVMRDNPQPPLGPPEVDADRPAF